MKRNTYGLKKTTLKSHYNYSLCALVCLTLKIPYQFSLEKSVMWVESFLLFALSGFTIPVTEAKQT